MTIVLVILLFGLMIFLHELGHFIVAKLSGVKVEQFTIGFGPAIFKKQIGETLYAIRLLPVGGAVMMKGESGEEAILVGETPDENPVDDSDSFNNASKLKRFFICIAGSMMNLISGILIMLILFAPVEAVYSATITDLADDFNFEGIEGFQVGDKITKVNGFNVYIYSDLITALTLGEGKPFDFTVIRDGEKIKLSDVNLEKNVIDEKTGKKIYGFSFGVEELNFGGRVGYAFKNAASFIQSAYKSLGMLVTGQVKSDQMMGTVGIAGEMNERAKQSSEELWYFVAFISINLAVVNMLPIPALDGGKVLFIFIELIAGRKINPKYENYISIVGLVLILGLFLYVTFNDVVRLLS